MYLMLAHTYKYAYATMTKTEAFAN